VASETRSPFSASSEIGACSVGGPCPANRTLRWCSRRVTVARARPLLPVPWRSFRCSVEIGQYLGSVALIHDRG
jgi:hypothetical protein